MAYNVNFLKGTAQSFADLAVKNKNTFYYIDEKDLYIGDVKLTNGEDLLAAVDRIAINEADIKVIKAQLDDLTGNEGGGDSSVTDLISALQIRIASVESALEAETQRATAAEQELSQSISGFTENLNSLSQLVNANETDIEKKVADLLVDIQKNTQGVTNLQSALDSVGGKIVANENNIKTIQGDISELEGIIDGLIGTDTDKSIRAIAIEVLVEQLLADGNTENFETLQQLAAWLADHPEEAAEMNLAIQANAKAIETLNGLVQSHDAALEELQRKVNELNSSENGVLAQAKAYTDEKVAEVSNALSNHINTTNATLETLSTDVDKNKQDIQAIIDPMSGLLAQAQAKLQELKDSLGTAAYKNVEDFDAAGSAAAALAEAKSYTDAALTWGLIQE